MFNLKEKLNLILKKEFKDTACIYKIVLIAGKQQNFNNFSIRLTFFLSILVVYDESYTNTILCRPTNTFR